MLDIETKSLWSHILGLGMAGELKGTRLKTIPADVMTWQAWQKQHPESTVLAMSRTRYRDYSKDFYRQPERFVVGFVGGAGMRHCSFAMLKKAPLLNVDADGLPVVILFSPESTSVRLFDRRVGDRVLTFTDEKGELRDEQTDSIWDRNSGIATDGTLKGTHLEAQVGIISFTRTWQTFHPKSREVIE